jgi:hypothetical protein
MRRAPLFLAAAGLAGIVCAVAVWADGPGPDVAGRLVVGMRGYPIAAQPPVDGQVYVYRSAWQGFGPETVSTGGSSGITGLTTGQLGVAGSATTLTSSIAFGLTGNSTIVETTSGGLLTPSILPLATNAAIGGMRGDTTTITCVAGVCSAVAGSSGLSGMTATQLPVAASATTVTSSVPVSAVSGNNTVVETGAGGKIANGFMTGQLACADLTNSVASCSVLPTLVIPATYIPGINPNNLPVAQINATRTVTAIKCRPEVAAGGAATITVVKAASGTAISAGTPLHSGSCNANGTAATDQTLTVTVSSLASGDTIGIITTGTTVWTSSGVAAGVVTVYMQ